MTIYAAVFPSVLGELFVAVDESGAVVALEFLKGRRPEEVAPHLAGELIMDDTRCSKVRRQVEEYLAGERRRFDLALAPRGTAFQREVWAELRRIPYGETASYGEIAHRLGRPGASRAVGRANATNPISLIVPCHRVVGADGSLTGYGGGLPVKERVLALERGEPLQLGLDLPERTAG